MKKIIPFVYQELMEAFTQPGCPACRLIRRSAEKQLSSLFYENVNDPGLRDELRKSLGFCHDHAYLALSPGIGDALGIAIIYHDVFRSLLRRLPEKSEDRQPNTLAALLGQAPRRLADQIKTTVRALLPQGRCPVCVQNDHATDLYLSELVNGIRREEFLQAFTGSSGLCIPHLSQAFEHTRENESYHLLLTVHRQKYAALEHELAELVRKSDYRSRDEGYGMERDAWLRAVNTAVGERRQAPNG